MSYCSYINMNLNLDSNLNIKYVQNNHRDTIPLKCRKCDKMGHIKANCPNKIIKDITKVICRKCNKKGHYNINCPDRIVVDINEIVCFICKKKGHYKSSCPDREFPRAHEYVCRKCEFGYGDDYGECECY
jgi:broad specificity polyphosphatase/5'/3'-nucleotidase SurE